jgi:hypothetical protein
MCKPIFNGNVLDAEEENAAAVGFKISRKF